MYFLEHKFADKPSKSKIKNCKLFLDSQKQGFSNPRSIWILDPQLGPELNNEQLLGLCIWNSIIAFLFRKSLLSKKTDYCHLAIQIGHGTWYGCLRDICQIFQHQFSVSMNSRPSKYSWGLESTFLNWLFLGQGACRDQPHNHVFQSCWIFLTCLLYQSIP